MYFPEDRHFSIGNGSCSHRAFFTTPSHLLQLFRCARWVPPTAGCSGLTSIIGQIATGRKKFQFHLSTIMFASCPLDASQVNRASDCLLMCRLCCSSSILLTCVFKGMLNDAGSPVSALPLKKHVWLVCPTSFSCTLCVCLCRACSISV